MKILPHPNVDLEFGHNNRKSFLVLMETRSITFGSDGTLPNDICHLISNQL